MAKAGEFKNKITKAQEELFKALENEQTKRNSTSSKIIQELSKANKANVKTLNSLNKEYLETCNNNKLELNNYIEKIKLINEDLLKEIDEFKESYNFDSEKEKHIARKDRACAPLRTKFKREIHDINIKINRIDQELKETLDTRNNENDQENVNYKNKIIEFDKKKRHEVNKIQSNTIKEYDELQKRLLVENKRSEIKNINKQIKEIRRNGLIDEKDCIFRNLEDQKQYELEHVKYLLDYKNENIKLEKEYNIRIEETKFNKSMIEFNYKKEFDKCDNDAIHNLNEACKQLQYKHSKNKSDLYSNIYNENINQFNYERKRNDDELNVVKNIYLSIENMDNKQIDKYLELNNKELNSIENELSLFEKNIVLTLNFYLQNLINSYKSYFKDLLTKEESFINNLLINTVQGDFLNGKNCDSYIPQIVSLFNVFREQEEKAVVLFEEELTNLLNNLILQVNEFVNKVKELNNKVNEQVINYNNSIRNILQVAKEEGNSFIENIINNINNEVANRENENNKLFEERKQAISLENEEIEKEFASRENEVKQQEQVLEEQYKVKYDELVKVKDDAIVLINQKYDQSYLNNQNEYDEKVKYIINKFNEEFSKLEKEYKVKIGLL